MDCAAGTYPLALDDWVADRLIEQKIWLYENGNEPRAKALFSEGLPKKDHKWVVLAKTCEAKAIISQDIDFIDCKNKCANAKVKAKIRGRESGPTKKWIKKETGADVWLVESVRSCLAA